MGEYKTPAELAKEWQDIKWMNIRRKFIEVAKSNNLTGLDLDAMVNWFRKEIDNPENMKRD